MRRLARWCFHHRIIVLLAWVAAVAGLNALESGVGSAYTDNFKLPHTQSFDAVALLQRDVPKASGDTEQIVIATKQGRLTDPAIRAKVLALLASTVKQPHVTTIGSPYTTTGAKQISSSGQIGFANVVFSIQANKVSAAAARAFVAKVTSASTNTLQFQVEGQIARAGNRDNSSSSLGIGFLAAAIVLFLVFGSMLSAALPLITAGMSLGAGIALVGLLSHAINMASFSNQLALLIGLGVGVDYALFIVTRYRQGLLRGLETEDAVIESLDTSGRAVLFAGAIVCIAMLGMFALGVSFLYGVAIAAAVAVSFTVVAALTLLPALLGFFGPRVLRRRERKALREGRLNTTDESPAWARWTVVMERRPVMFGLAAAAVMVVIAIPFFSMRLGSADAGSDPANTTTRKAYDLLAKGFGPGYNGPLQLVAQINSRAQAADFLRIAQTVAHTPGVVGAAAPKFLLATGGRSAVAIANVYPKDSPQAASTATLLHTVRDHVVPTASRGTGLTVLVGGNTAIFDDFSHVLAAKLPLFIGIVVLLSFVLLMAVFRSVLVPLTAAAMNMLSVGAALGIVTAIFQNGWGASLLGIDTTGPIEAFLPVLMFPILFGLSMDYEVFLVSRIYEEWHRRGDTREAVTHGLAATGRTITAAATIMVLVFGAFVLGGQRVIELFGIGLASAVLLDALIVRSVIVPAVMLLLGERNWWLPAWLERLLPHLNIEGADSRSGDFAGAKPGAQEGVTATPEPARSGLQG
jgi:putative drug exporter of the RND superfamily